MVAIISLKTHDLAANIVVVFIEHMCLLDVS